MKIKNGIRGFLPSVWSKDCFKVKLLTLLIILGGIMQFTAVYAESDEVSSLLQLRKISGKVTDSKGEPVIGATVVVKGVNGKGTITNVDGKYVLTDVDKNATLSFFFVGMDKKEVVVGSESVINVTLEEGAVNLSEVIAIGYGTVTKKEVTGSVATITEKSFNKGDMANAMSLIQGKVPGLTITNSSGGSPDGSFQLRLRGLNSLMGGKSPLVIVDGVLGTMDMIDPNQVASIDVLKDGSAAAIYGTRATNGVILITTKKPDIGKVKFDFSTYAAYQTLQEDNRFLTAAEYRKLITERGLTDFDKGSSLNAVKEIARPQLNQYYSFTASGGTKDLNFKGNVYFKDNEGIVIGTKSTIFTPSLFVSQSALDDKLKIDYRMTYNKQRNKGLGNNGVVKNALIRNPTEPIYDPNDEAHGGYYTNTANLNQVNPMAQIKERTNDVDNQTFSGDINASYLLFDALKLRMHGTYYNNQNYVGTFLTRFYPNQASNQASLSTSSYENVLFEPDFEYSKSFLGHTIKLLGGYSYYSNTGKSFDMTNYDFDYDVFKYNNIGSGSALQDGLAEMESNKQSNKLIAFYSRLMYNYQQKYLLSASIRREGSSRFGKNNKWGWFPAVSLAWRIDEESFTDDLSWLSDFKLRAGYGVTGNQDIGNYLSLERMRVGSKLMYYNQEWINSYEPASNPNPDLKWEKKDEYNVGADFGFFDSRITGSVDVYYRLISDLLWNYDVPVPPNVYPTTTANVGKMSNKGLEVQLNFEFLKGKNYSWMSSVSYSMNRNEMISFSDESKGYTKEYLDMTPVKGFLTQTVVPGKPVGDFYAMIYQGVDPNDPTKIIYKNSDGSVDENGNPTIDNRLDREVVGNQYPIFELGWNNNFQYKNWDFSFFIRTVYGASALNYERVWYESWNGLNGGKNILRSTLTNHPEYTGLEVYDNRFVEDASYVKLDNVTMGYNFNFAKNSCRLYFTAQNLLTLTKYTGVDPEKAIPENFDTQASGDGSDQLPYYPYTRKFLLGLSFKF